MRVEALGPMRTASTPSIRGGREARIGGLGTPSRSDRALGSRRLDGTARLPRRTGNPRPRRTLPMRLSRNGMRGTVGPRAGRWPTIDAVGRGSLVGAPSSRIRSQPHQNRWPPCAKLVWSPCAKVMWPPCAKLERTPHEGGDPDLKLRGTLPPGGFRLWEAVRLRKAAPLGETIQRGVGRSSIGRRHARGGRRRQGHCHVAVVGSTPFALAFSSMIDFSQSVRPGSILS